MGEGNSLGQLCKFCLLQYSRGTEGFGPRQPCLPFPQPWISRTREGTSLNVSICESKLCPR